MWEMGSKSSARFLCHYMLYITLGHCLITVINIICTLTFLSLQMFVHDLGIFQSQYETCGLTLSAWYCHYVGHRLPGWTLPHTSRHRNRKSSSRPNQLKNNNTKITRTHKISKCITIRANGKNHHKKQNYIIENYFYISVERRLWLNDWFLICYRTWSNLFLA